MEVKFCPNCGASVPENSKFCLSCGTNLSTIASQPTTSITESSPITPPKIVSNSNITDLEVSNARMKSYTGTAILVFFLYFLFYFPGLIVNYIYYQEAKKMEEKAGMSLPGVSLLSIMLFINVVVFGLSVVITAFLTMGIFGN
jgi:uncharacterized membrane protein YvbJ